METVSIDKFKQNLKRFVGPVVASHAPLKVRDGDVNLAWPSAEIAVMGPKGAVKIIFREEAKDADAIEQRTAEYREKFANPFIAGRRGYIDDVIFPRDTRKRLCRSLTMLRGKRLENPWKRHGNVPL